MFLNCRVRTPLLPVLLSVSCPQPKTPQPKTPKTPDSQGKGNKKPQTPKTPQTPLSVDDLKAKMAASIGKVSVRSATWF